MNNDYFSLLVCSKCINIGNLYDFLSTYRDEYPSYSDYLEHDFPIDLSSQYISQEKLTEFEYNFLCSYLSLRICL